MNGKRNRANDSISGPDIAGGPLALPRELQTFRTSGAVDLNTPS
jgi:hypothetical protein